jgi:hypothetical protein
VHAQRCGALTREIVFVIAAVVAGEAVAQPTAQVHWRDVPLRDAISRLEELFDEPIFVDRRIDSGRPVNLDVDAYRLEDALEPVASSCGLEVGRVGGLVYLGPQQSAARLAALSSLRSEEIRQMPTDARAGLEAVRPLFWPRLGEPRSLATALVEQRDWKLLHAERIPHDLWTAGELPALPLADQLTILLLGFDLSFAVNASDRTVEVVPIDAVVMNKIAAKQMNKRQIKEKAKPTTSQTGKQTTSGRRQVYSLRVAEQPVSAVLKEFTRRLNWRIEIDEAAIRAAGRSIDARVSFAVQNVGQDELLEALLQPAGLTFRRDGAAIQIVPRKPS